MNVKPKSADHSRAANDGADNADAVASSDTARSTAPEAPSDRSAAVRAKSTSATDESTVEADTAIRDAAAAWLAPADITQPKDPSSVMAPTAAELASIGALAALSVLPVAPMLSASTATGPIAEPGGGAAAGIASPEGLFGPALSTVPLAADATAGLLVTAEAEPKSDRGGPAVRGLPDNAPIAIDAPSADAATTAPQVDATVAGLALLSAGLRPDAEREGRPGTEMTTPSAWAVGASTSTRAIDAAAPPPASASVSTPLTDSGFHEALGMQVSLLAREGVQKAELRLNPADMGPVSVQITMNGDQARVDFGADLAQTRQVIEAGWAELAASLREAGFTLSGGGVSQHARDRNGPEAAPSGGADRSAEADEVPVAAVVVAARPRAGAALDLYA